jgi:hypothetical protein
MERNSRHASRPNYPCERRHADRKVSGLRRHSRHPHGEIPRLPRPGRRGAGHRLFLSLLALGAALRVVVVLAYQPALEFVQDSFSYLHAARAPYPDVIRPIGYSFFLKLLSLTHLFALVPITQHALGLASACIIYALLMRFGLRPWICAVASAPTLLSAYQLNIEHFILAETFFQFLVVTGLALLIVPRHPTPRTCAAAGALLGLAAVTRTVGLPLIGLALLYMLVRRLGPARTVSAGLAAALIVGGYAVWFRAENGRLGLENYNGYFLAGRVSPFADCRTLRLSAPERTLCDDRPDTERHNTDWYVWNPQAPIRRPDGPPGEERPAIAMGFALQVIRHQPGDYLASVGKDLVHYFGPGRWSGPADGDMQAWRFPGGFRLDPWQPLHPPADPYIWLWTWPGNNTVTHGIIPARYAFGLRRVDPVYRPTLGRTLRAYQRFAYLPGPVLALAILVAIGAGLQRVPQPQREMRDAAVLLALAGTLMIMIPAATATFDYRYLLPAEPLIMASAVLGAGVGAARWGRFRAGPGAEPVPKPRAGTVEAARNEQPAEARTIQIHQPWGGVQAG